METISQVLFWVANSLLIPDIILLLLLFIRSLLLIGGVYNQYMTKRKNDKQMNRLIKELTPDTIGELKVVRKYRGSLPICVGKYITDLLDGRDDIDNSMVFISSCQPKPGCMEAIKAGLRKYGKFENIIETDIGTTIGGYSGPGTIGIVFAKKV